MNEREAAIKRYQNDLVFQKFVDVLVDILERGTMDRYALMDALQVAEEIQYQNDRARNGAGK